MAWTCRRRDMNNLHKLLCDALEGVVYLDEQDGVWPLHGLFL